LMEAVGTPRDWDAFVTPLACHQQQSIHSTARKKSNIPDTKGEDKEATDIQVEIQQAVSQQDEEDKETDKLLSPARSGYVEPAGNWSKFQLAIRTFCTTSQEQFMLRERIRGCRVFSSGTDYKDYRRVLNKMISRSARTWMHSQNQGSQSALPFPVCILEASLADKLVAQVNTHKPDRHEGHMTCYSFPTTLSLYEMAAQVSMPTLFGPSRMTLSLDNKDEEVECTPA